MGDGQNLDAPRRRSPSRLGAAAPLAALLATAACGSSSGTDSSTSQAIDPPGPGVVFSYPMNGQWDVPLRARLLLTLSRPPATPVDTACSRADGVVTGAFCVEGPDGFVAGALTVSGATLAFLPTGGLAAGTVYRVWARPALLPGATNLPTDTPIVSFRTRSTRSRPGRAASVLTVNGAALAADGSSPLSLHDLAPIRLVFSEPLDRRTIGAGTVRLVHVASGGAVDGLAVAHGIHLTFDPTNALVAGDLYRLEVDAAVKDLGGEAIAPVAVTFTATRTASPGEGLYPLPMSVAPPFTTGAPQPPSRIGAMPVNSYAMSSLLDGDTTGGVLAGGLDVLGGDPSAGPTIPLFLPRGGRLDLTSRSILTGGVVATGKQTGTVHFTLLTDGFGVMRRNPFRSPDQVPDDAESPTFLDLTLDAVITSDDPLGNAISTQTVMGIRVLGIATVDGDQLAVEQVSAIDYQVLGLETAPIWMVQRMRTGGHAAVPPLGLPTLTASNPPSGARDVPAGDPIELDFSGPLEPVLRDGFEVTIQGGTGASVPAGVRLEGSTVTVVPAQRLDEGTTYTLHWAGLRALSGGLLPSGALSFTTAVTTASSAVAPILLALYPGAPCALTGATAETPGHCVGGRATDSGYLPFTLPANHDVRAYFSLPLDPASLALGEACGQGSVRVEQVGASGQCAAVVPGTLVKLDRELRFVPTSAWTPGAAYRLTLVAGANASCEPNEICAAGIGGHARVPLNTDPLTRYAGGAGGPDVVIDFTAVPATTAVFQPLVSDTIADTNADGFVNGNEVPNDRNREMHEVAGLDGILLTSVTLDGGDCAPSRPGKQSCVYTTSALPSIIRGVREHCPVDPQGLSSTMPYPCLEVQTVPGIILQTSSSMTTTPLVGFPQSSPTGQQIIRVREQGKPVLGYIFNEPGQSDPQYLLVEDTYLDAPDLVVSNATHDLHSKPLHMTLKGPLTYRPDGKTQVALRNLNDSLTSVTITGPLSVTGNIRLRTPAGEMRVTLAELPKR